MLKSKSKQKKAAKNGNFAEEIEVDVDSDKPTEASIRLLEQHPVTELPTDVFLHNPRAVDSLRFVCISDTHGCIEHQRREFDKRIPDGDVLIHCGDFSMGGMPSEILQFNSFISRLPHPVKLVIAGNHENTFESNFYSCHPTMLRKQLGLSISASDDEVERGCKDLLQSMLYLQDEALEICGIRLYGTPWVPQFGSWGFSVHRGQRLLDKWNQIPSDTDILITHGPPCGIGDTVSGGKHAGCVELFNTVVKRVKPKFHVFGHIHTGYGMWKNKTTTFINAAVCSNKYKPDHDPVVFDFPLPKGYSRSDFAKLSTESLRQARQTRMEEAEQGGTSENGATANGEDYNSRFMAAKETSNKTREESAEFKDAEIFHHGQVMADFLKNKREQATGHRTLEGDVEAKMASVSIRL